MVHLPLGAVVEVDAKPAVVRRDAAIERPVRIVVSASRARSQTAAAGRMHRYATQVRCRSGSSRHRRGKKTSQFSPGGPTSLGGYMIRWSSSERSFIAPGASHLT